MCVIEGSGACSEGREWLKWRLREKQASVRVPSGVIETGPHEMRRASAARGDVLL